MHASCSIMPIQHACCIGIIDLRLYVLVIASEFGMKIEVFFPEEKYRIPANNDVEDNHHLQKWITFPVPS